MAVNKSNHIISMMSLVGIILVVFGHSGFEEPIIMEKLKVVHNWIYSFHMPLFFFISGFLFAFTNKDLTNIDYTSFIKKKFNRLYIPYIVLGLIIFGIKYFLSNFSHIDRTFSLENFFMMFIAPHWTASTMGYLWYIATLFFLFIFVSILGVFKVNLRKPITAFILIIILWFCKYKLSDLISIEFLRLFNMGSIMWYLPFFIIGIQFQPFYDKALVVIEKYTYKIFIITNILLVFSSYYFANRGIDNFGIKIISSFLGILMTVSLSQLLLKNTFLAKCLLPIADLTYTIYLMSFFGQYFVKYIIGDLFNLHWSICVLCMFISGLLFPICLYRCYLKMTFLHKFNIIKLCIGI